MTTKDDTPEGEPFYFFCTKNRAYVYTTVYRDKGDAVRAAYDVNRLTGLLTCMTSRRFPQLVFVRKQKLLLILHGENGGYAV